MNIRYIYLLFLSTLFFLSCDREDALIYFIQNQHPGFDTLDVCIAYVSDKNSGSDCTKLQNGDSLLWAGPIAYSNDKLKVYAKQIDLKKIQNRNNPTKYSVRVQISYKGEPIMDSRSSLSSGKNYEMIVIKRKNDGSYDVNSVGSAKRPEGMEKFKLEALDELSKHYFEKQK